ncbi:hypothetical protein ACQ4N7_03560 [Nodosilinea sp. AN01ver1]|uniref:hypothetical protein n=1 Tax=Nodosilinea sp. AN01ver1 TaxID=3423362 RepID=UPI003D313BDC
MGQNKRERYSHRQHGWGIPEFLDRWLYASSLPKFLLTTVADVLSELATALDGAGSVAEVTS